MYIYIYVYIYIYIYTPIHNVGRGGKPSEELSTWLIIIIINSNIVN